MSEATAPQLPPEIQAHIRAGGEVRTDPAHEFAGRCGKRVERRNGDAFCRRAAGWGTPHLGIGTCRDHPLDAPGLAPWVGSVSPAEWQRITGHNDPAPGGGFVTTHGASGPLKSIEDLFSEALADDDRAMFNAVPAGDPIRLLDVVIRVNVVSLARVHRHITTTRSAYAQAGVAPPESATAGSESLAAKISGVIARLQESRAKYVEIDKRSESREGLADLLRGLSAEDFARVSADPSLMDRFTPAAL